MPILACGFEAGDTDYYLKLGWSPGAAIGGHFVHKDANGFGGSYAANSVSTTNPLITPKIADSANTRWFHFWMSRGDTTTWANGCPISFFSGNEIQFTVRIQDDGSIQLRRGAVTGTLVATSAGNLDMAVGHWFAVEMTIANAGGICNVYVDDGALFVGFTGDTQNFNTQIALTGNWDSVSMGATSGCNAWFDDLIVTNVTDGQITETYGRQQLLTSDAATGLTPSTGTNNWSNVLDFDLSRYNAGTTATTQDLYGAEGNLVLGVVDWVSLRVLVASQNGFEMQTALKSGSTTDYGTLRSGGPSDYDGHSVVYYTTDPDTAVAWTASGVNALQAGVRTGT